MKGSLKEGGNIWSAAEDGETLEGNWEQWIGKRLVDWARMEVGNSGFDGRLVTLG